MTNSRNVSKFFIPIYKKYIPMKLLKLYQNKVLTSHLKNFKKKKHDLRKMYEMNISSYNLFFVWMIIHNN